MRLVVSVNQTLPRAWFTVRLMSTSPNILRAYFEAVFFVRSRMDDEAAQRVCPPTQWPTTYVRAWGSALPRRLATTSVR